MRAGTITLVAALVLLFTGLVSTNKFKPTQTTQQTTFDMTGIAIFDVSAIRNETLEIVSGNGMSSLSYENFYDAKATSSIRTARTNDLLKIVSEDGGMSYIRSKIRIFPTLTLKKILVSHLEIEAKTDIDALTVEGESMAWSGNAESLTLIQKFSDEYNDSSNRLVDFRKGEVKQLRIDILDSRGKFNLGDISQVQNIVLNIHPNAEFTINEVKDLQKIHINYVGSPNQTNEKTASMEECSGP